MKSLTITLILMLLAAAAIAADNKDIPPFPPSLMNARFAYVTSYDGDQFSAAVLPQDRHAISVAQDAVEKWGKWTLVYKPEEADVVLMVSSHPSEDVLGLYDAHGWPKNEYLWRMTARDGLQKPETSLVVQLRKAYEKAASPSAH